MFGFTGHSGLNLGPFPRKALADLPVALFCFPRGTIAVEAVPCSMSVSCTQPSWAPAVAPCPQEDRVQSSAPGGLQEVRGKTSGCSGVGAKTPGVRAWEEHSKEQRENKDRVADGPGSATPQTPQTSGCPVCCP